MWIRRTVRVMEALSHEPAAVAARDQLRRTVLAVMGMKRLSQEALASQLGMSQPQLSKKIRGRQPFDEDDLQALATWLGVSVPDLYDLPKVLSRFGYFTDFHALPGFATDRDGQMELPFRAALTAVS